MKSCQELLKTQGTWALRVCQYTQEKSIWSLSSVPFAVQSKECLMNVLLHQRKMTWKHGWDTELLQD